MAIAWSVLILSSIFFIAGLRVFLEALNKKISVGLPWSLKKLPEVTAADRFPRSLFRMRGMTGGPIPLRAPLSGKECYYYEIIYTPRERHASDSVWNMKSQPCMTLLKQSRNFTFYSPKGPVNVQPEQFSKDCMTSMNISHSTRIPLPLEVRQKIQSLQLGEGHLEERILPAHTSLQLVGRVEYKDPAHWRMKKGPGVFPILSSHPEAIQTISGRGIAILPLSKSLMGVLCFGISFVGYYFFRLILAQ